MLGQLPSSVNRTMVVCERGTSIGRAALAAKRARRERTSRFAPYGFTLTPAGTLEPNAVERDQFLVIAECRAAGFSTRSGRPIVGRAF